MRGRLAQVAEAKVGISSTNAYRWLSETVKLLADFEVLQFTAEAQLIYQDFKSQRIRVGTQDLRIASIAIAHKRSATANDRGSIEYVPQTNSTK